MEMAGISLDDILAIAAHQRVEIKQGDILLIRTGFLKWYESSSPDERERAFAALNFAGVQQGDEVQRYLWNNRVAAVAGDAVSWERMYHYRPLF